MTVARLGSRAWSLTRRKRPSSSPATAVRARRRHSRARPTGSDSLGRATFTTTSPEWWMHGRVFGGMVVAQALNAAMQTVPEEFEVHSLHGYFLRPTSPGSRSDHVVDGVRDGRSFRTRQVVSQVDGQETFRMMCSFHAPEQGDMYQLPVTSDIPSPRETEGFEAPFPFDVRELGATERLADGTYESTRRCWFRTTRASARTTLRCTPASLAYFSDMTGASFRPLSLGTWGTHTDASLDHAAVVPPALASRRVEHLRCPRARERRWPRNRSEPPCTARTARCTSAWRRSSSFAELEEPLVHLRRRRGQGRTGRQESVDGTA